MITRRRRHEEGAASSEFVAVAVLVVSMIAAVWAANLPDRVQETATEVSDCLFDTDCELPEAASGSGDTDDSSGSTDSESGSTDSESGSTDSESGSTDSESGSTDGESGSTDGESGSTDGENPDDDDGTIPLDERQDPDEILEEYQVSDAETVEWEPGFPLNLLTDPRTITEREAEMLDGLSALQQKAFKDIHDDAFSTADSRFPSDDRNDDHNDAFRHAYWNALLASEFGNDWAEDFATAHEQLPGNPPGREAMDLYNNEVGRQVAADNPDASPEELADLVQQAVEDGQTVVVDGDGDLTYSDQITPEETGDPKPGNLPGEDPEFNDVDAES